MKTATHHREPLVHIVKRTDISTKKAVLIRAIAVIVSLLFSALLVFVLKGINPIQFFTALFEGAFGTSRRIWILLQKTAVLLCISLAVTPAFKMRFWNTGAEGQVLVGGLATCACMYYLGGALPLPLLYLLMIVSSIVAGIIWAVIPAIFKAKWNTNETLFTLMMNYVATFLVSFFINTWVTSGSGTLAPMSQYGLPRILNNWLLNIIIVAVLTVAVYIYLRFSKQGYEISVVGESENTARYIGINVKKVIIRTLIVSGALCGVAGLILVGGTNHTIATDTVGGQGFTAIMVSWLGKFNPLFMVLTSFLVIFLEVGANQISNAFKMNSSISDIITAVILFFIIGCEFFINYKIMFRKAAKEDK
ncbi:MAG: ABC transporter permease [Oscillospiraceae bacterium]|nr:ABC transporter permease [Oscillospiraceae bacterium]